MECERGLGKANGNHFGRDQEVHMTRKHTLSETRDEVLAVIQIPEVQMSFNPQ